MTDPVSPRRDAGDSSTREQRLAAEVAALAERVRPPTDDATDTLRPCPDCGYDIHPGYQHSRMEQPPGASHSVCSLDRAFRWDRLDPPWPRRDGGCGRCDVDLPPYHRHFWPGCRACSVWSVAGQALMAAIGLNGHAWLYWGARPWCGDCRGSGFLPCVLQDLSVLRMSGACQTCGAW